MKRRSAEIDTDYQQRIADALELLLRRQCRMEEKLTTIHERLFIAQRDLETVLDDVELMISSPCSEPDPPAETLPSRAKWIN